MALALSRRTAISVLLTGVAAISTAGASVAASSTTTEVPVIAVAASVQFAMEEIAAAFTAETGQSVKLAFGASGNFARQVQQGAPFQMFLSADERYVRNLAEAGFTRGDGALYAVGRIGIIVPRGSPLKADGSLADLAAAVEAGRVTRFAIANPEHAPYGKRAEEALRHQGLWDGIKPNLVFGENIAQAAQFATSGNAQGGIIAHSLALDPRVASLGEFALIPEKWHSPLRQQMVLLKAAGPVAERFYGYVQGSAARAVFRKYGFVLPGETT